MIHEVEDIVQEDKNNSTCNCKTDTYETLKIVNPINAIERFKTAVSYFG